MSDNDKGKVTEPAAGFASPASAGYAVGDRVISQKDVYEPVSDDAPGGLLCTKGELLVVRELKNCHIYVSHPEVKDKMFWVYDYEIRPHNPKLQETAARSGPSVSCKRMLGTVKEEGQ